MNNVVSIAVCAYNASKTLHTPLQSLINQSYRPLEIILIDDCSKDNTLQILNEFKQEHETDDFSIKVIRLDSNGGIANGRNTAINCASGKWFSFLDADDSYDKDYVFKMVNEASKNDADLVICDFYKRFTTSDEYTIGINMNSESMMEAALMSYPCPWNKLYKTSLIQLLLPIYEPTIYDDMSGTHKIIINSDHIVYLNQALVYYTMGEGISQTYNEKMLQLLQVVKNRYFYLKQYESKFVDYEQFALYDCVPRLFDQLIAIIQLSNKTVIFQFYNEMVLFLNSEFRNKWKQCEYFKTNRVVLKVFRNMLKHKITFLLIVYNPLVRKYISSNYRL